MFFFLTKNTTSVVSPKRDALRFCRSAPFGGFEALADVACEDLMAERKAAVDFEVPFFFQINITVFFFFFK